jgi:isopentenyl-diphosphate delta-isomerase
MEEQGTDRVVSSEAEELILVDADDNTTGFLSKAKCHDGDGIQHRAFSLFLFDTEGRLLLQQRAADKRLWPGYWSNSCCSHPRRGESMQTATQRRLHDELNCSTELEYVYRFAYQASYGTLGSENELCHVYLGRVSADVRPNEREIAAIRFVSVTELKAELAGDPERFTPWFKMEWDSLQKQHSEVLQNYLSRRDDVGID